MSLHAGLLLGEWLLLQRSQLPVALINEASDVSHSQCMCLVPVLGSSRDGDGVAAASVLHPARSISKRKLFLCSLLASQLGTKNEGGISPLTMELEAVQACES